jgi:hypothetical protein
MKPHAGKSRRKKIVLLEAPQNGALLARQDSGDEQSRLRRKTFPRCPEGFVKRAGVKTACRQMRVNCFHAKPQRHTLSCVGALKKADALAQLRQGWMRIQHWACLCVPDLFSWAALRVKASGISKNDKHSTPYTGERINVCNLYSITKSQDAAGRGKTTAALLPVLTASAPSDG